MDPHPQPLPTRGRGADRVRCSRASTSSCVENKAGTTPPPTQTGLSESNPGLDSAKPISAERSPGMQAPDRSPGVQAAERAPAAQAAEKAPAVQAAVVTPRRDLRLDLFRGIALWLIFLDHIPSNLVAWGTLRNYGFSDATEIFVFVSGYTAAFVYGKEMRERGPIIAGAHILRRVWQIYVAHVFLFAIYLAEISYLATSIG